MRNLWQIKLNVNQPSIFTLLIFEFYEKREEGIRYVKLHWKSVKKKTGLHQSRILDSLIRFDRIILIGLVRFS